MSSEWAHAFCLTCDKQTDGTTYCSESCRLADYETTSSTTSSGPSSPSFTGSSYPWSFSKPAASSTKFYLSPAYDFTNPQPYRPTTQTSTAKRNDSLTPPNRILSPSSSHSSLCSMRSSSSAGVDASQQLSEKARKELLAYASSFENVRSQRRRSY